MAAGKWVIRRMCGYQYHVVYKFMSPRKTSGKPVSSKFVDSTVSRVLSRLGRGEGLQVLWPEQNVVWMLQRVLAYLVIHFKVIHLPIFFLYRFNSLRIECSL